MYSQFVVAIALNNIHLNYSLFFLKTTRLYKTKKTWRHEEEKRSNFNSYNIFLKI